MTWGQIQNLLSIIIALNIAYYAFSQIRAPHLATLRNRITQLRADIKQHLDDLQLPGLGIPRMLERETAVADLYASVSKFDLKVIQLELIASSRKIDNFLGIPAMLIAAVLTAFLVFSCIYYNDKVPICLFWATVFLGFLPAVGFIAFNYVVLWISADYDDEFLELMSKLHDDIFGDMPEISTAIARARYEQMKRKLM